MAVAAEYGWLLLAAGWTMLAAQMGWWMCRLHAWGGARPEAAAPRVAVQPAATTGLAGSDGAGDPAGSAGRAGPAGQTAAGDDMGPSGWSGDHTDRGDRPSNPVDDGRAAPAPTEPVASGLGGGHPDIDLDLDGPPVTPGADADAERARIVMRVVEHLASASLTEDDDEAIDWEDRARRELATLTTGGLIEVVIEALAPDAIDRGQVLVNQFRTLPATDRGAL